MKIAVLGSGLMGRVMATRLIRQGFTDVALIEKDKAKISNSPAIIAAGMLSALCESVMGGELIYTLGKNSINLWQQYLLQLNTPYLLNDKGTLLIAQPEFFSEAKHYIAKIGFNSQRNNYYQLLNQGELKNLEVELNFDRAYFLPDEGVLNAPELMHQLGNYLHQRVNWKTGCEVINVAPTGELTLKNRVEKYDWLIDCRGMGAYLIYPNLRAVRGEIIRVHAPEVNISRPIRLFHPRHNIYISPSGKNNYAIGATELESADYSPVSVRSTLDLLNCAIKVHSGFAEARITASNSSCRPTLYDNLPQIKLDKHLIGINGLYRHGYLLAPGLAEEVIQYLQYGTCNYAQIWCQ